MVVRSADRGAAPLADRLFGRMRWDMFYDPDASRPGGLMHGGFYDAPPPNPDATFTGNHIGVGPDVWYTKHHYDTTVSETRITSYLGILTGQVPAQHYFAMWRTFPASCDWSWQEMQPVGQTRTYLGLDVYEGAYTYRGMHIVPGWGGSMFEELMPDVFVPEASWAPRSWGVNHPLHVRAQREHGLDEAGYGYWGFSPSSEPCRRLPRVRRRRPRPEPGGLLLRPREDQLRRRLRRLPPGDQPQPDLRRRGRHPARLVPGDDARAAAGLRQPRPDPERARRVR